MMGCLFVGKETTTALMVIESKMALDHTDMNVTVFQLHTHIQSYNVLMTGSTVGQGSTGQNSHLLRS